MQNTTKLNKKEECTQMVIYYLFWFELRIHLHFSFLGVVFTYLIVCLFAICHCLTPYFGIKREGGGFSFLKKIQTRISVSSHLFHLGAKW